MISDDFLAQHNIMVGNIINDGKELLVYGVYSVVC